MKDKYSSILAISLSGYLVPYKSVGKHPIDYFVKGACSLCGRPFKSDDAFLRHYSKYHLQGKENDPSCKD